MTLSTSNTPEATLPGSGARAPWRRWLLGAGAAMAAIALVACGGDGDDDGNGGRSATESPTAVATEPAATSTAEVTATTEATPTGTAEADGTPEAAQEHSGLVETDAFQIELPEGWVGYDTAADSLEAVHAAMMQRWADLPMLQQGPAVLAGPQLWAFETEPSELFVSNLNIMVEPKADAPEDAEALRELLLPSYEADGIIVVESEAQEINGRPAVYLFNDMSQVVGEGVYSVQYLVIGEESIYALSYAAFEDDLDAMTPVFEASAHSFQER